MDANEMRKNILAKQTYKTLLEALDGINFSYINDDEHLSVSLKVGGERGSYKFVFIIDEKRQLIRLLSPLPIQVIPDRFVNMCVAVCLANNIQPRGRFDFEMREDGRMLFIMNSSFESSVIGKAVFVDMLYTALLTMDLHVDPFNAFNDGKIDLGGFLAALGE